MKKTMLIQMALSALLISPPLLAGGTSPIIIGTDEAPIAKSQATETVTQVGPHMLLRHITYHGSDIPAVGDPLGNGPVTPKHDAGPALTQRIHYGPGCTHEACIRACNRWNSPASWRQDRSKGGSIGWGKSSC